MINQCETDLERIKIQLLRMRQLVAATRFPDTVALFWSVLSEYGYDPSNPIEHHVRCPQSAGEFADLDVPTQVEDDPPDEDIPSVILSMMGESDRVLC
jgi:hypothetical protein